MFDRQRVEFHGSFLTPPMHASHPRVSVDPRAIGSGDRGDVLQIGPNGLVMIWIDRGRTGWASGKPLVLV